MATTMMAAAKRTRSIPFAEAAQITPLGSHEYKAHVHGDYSFGNGGHGGFLVTLILRAVAMHFRTTLARYNQHDTVAIHAEFLRPAVLGDITVNVADTRLGRGSSTVHASLHQRGKDVVVCYVTNLDRSITKGVTKSTGYGISPPIPSIDFDAVLSNNDLHWIKYQIPYKDPSHNKALSNIISAIQKVQPSESTLVQQWVTLSCPDERWTNDMLSMVCDFFVPPPENLYESPHTQTAMSLRAIEWAQQGMPKEHFAWQVPRWYPTVNMSIDVKRSLPPEGMKWLFTKMKTDALLDGRFDVRGEVWDVDGRLVAITQQVWMAVGNEAAAFVKARKEGRNWGKL